MAHGQHHEPRQPMRRRQPHRGSRGQPSATVAAARGQIAPAIHSTKTCPAELQLVRYLSNACGEHVLEPAIRHVLVGIAHVR